MNKFSKKINYQFVSGNINHVIFDYLNKIAELDIKDSDACILDEHISNLSNLNINTIEDCDKYFYIYANCPIIIERLTYQNLSNKEILKLCKFASVNKNKYNFKLKHNLCKLALDFLIENKELLKKSHPNNSGIDGDNIATPQYNVDKWIETMRYIYNAANTNNLPLDSITKKVTSQWDENERINFNRWMKYYQEGNYNKYNVKTAQFFTHKQDVTKSPDIDSVKNMFQPLELATPSPIDDKKRRLEEARKKLRGRLKSVEELLEQFRDVLPKDLNAGMRKDVYDLKEKIVELELKASIVDSIIRTSNKFIKNGFVEGAMELKKIAQEVAENKLPPAAPEQPVAAATPADTIKVPEMRIGEDIDIPDFSSATHRDALQKLEEINKVISERNVVRALAAVDIILGQLGIASYFPSLSEAQSKLMDAFNYAGTRVAETIGQMRGGGGGGIVVNPKPNQETVEVSEETEKPIGEVVKGKPPQVVANPPTKTEIK